MPITPETRDRLTAGLVQLIRTGRQVSGRAADSVYGDLPSFGWSLLLPLERDGAQRCSALAGHAGIDVSVASRQVAALEHNGYLERHPDPADGRASLLSITPAGTEALRATRAVRSAWALSALSGWDERDARRLTDLLERLVADVATDGLPRGGAARPAAPGPR